jgi:hypothetical protein
MQPETVRTKKPAPQNLITCSRLPHAEKMAIFNQRIIRVLRFLIDENYSSLENIARLLNVPKQTSSRICRHLCDKGYLNRVEVDIGLARSISVFQPTNTGIMFALYENEDIPELREVNRVNPATVYHDLKLQQIRLNLEAQGYTNFQSSWQLSRILKKRNEKVPTIPDYTCFDLEGNKIAIEYERTIKSRKRYQEIIGQYMDIKERGIIKKVIYYAEPGFASKLQHLFESIEFIYRRGRTEKYISEQLTYFKFVDSLV